MCWMVSHYGCLWMEWLQQSDRLNYPCNWQLTMARQSTSLGDAFTWLLCRLWPWAKSQRAGGQYWANGAPYFVYSSGDSGNFSIHSLFIQYELLGSTKAKKEGCEALASHSSTEALESSLAMHPHDPPLFSFLQNQTLHFRITICKHSSQLCPSLQEKDSEILDSPKLGHVLCGALQHEDLFLQEAGTVELNPYGMSMLWAWPHCCPVFMLLHGPLLTP